MLFYFISPLLNTSARKLQCRQHETFLSETFPAQWWPRLFPSSLGTGFFPSVPDRVATWGHQCWPRHPAEPLEPAPPLAERKLLWGPEYWCGGLVKKHSIILAEPYKCYKLHTLLEKPVGKAPAYPKTGLKDRCSICLSPTSDNSHLFQKIQG